MPVANLGGVHIRYEVLGDRGPWLALSPGGRRGLVSVKSLGEKIAEAGHRVVVYDRRNCGGSDVAIGGQSENHIWADDLHTLLTELDALPAYVGGSSSGCRLSMILALKHPEAVRALLLWRVTGGAYAAQQLTRNYYTQFIEAAQTGGMAAVCATEHFADVIKNNPANRERLMAMTPKDFTAAMERWRASFLEGTEHPVIGVSAAELRSMTLPACIVPGNDRIHPRGPGQAAHRLMPNSEYHEVLTEDRMDVDVAFDDWDAKEGLLAAVFIDYLRRLRRRG
jgi:pimeloyl-ACP methyl ester carboxylesterase